MSAKSKDYGSWCYRQLHDQNQIILNSAKAVEYERNNSTEKKRLSLKSKPFATKDNEKVEIRI